MYNMDKMDRKEDGDDSNKTSTPATTLTASTDKKITKRRHGGTLKDDTSYFCLSENLCDIWFSSKNSSVKLPAHKLLLSMRSEVFEAMFYGPMAESSDTIIIEDIEITTMKIILRYIYTDDVHLDGKNVMECLYAAKKYALHGLVNVCLKFLEEAITVGTSCAIYEQAKFYGETSLQEKCFDYIVENSNGVFKSESFRTLTYESLHKILKCDHLASDESVNFVAAKVWAENQCKKKDLAISPENMRSCLGDIIFLIRFPLMAIETFARQVTTTGILTSDEMLMVYHHLATKSAGKEDHLGRFSCKKRTVILRVVDTILSQSYEGCLVLLNTSSPVKLVSVKGDFVSHVRKISASNAGRQDIAFNALGDQLDLKDPLIIRPHSGNIQIVFQLSEQEDVRENTWSSNANISRTVKDTTINVRRVPHGLHSLVFEEV